MDGKHYLDCYKACFEMLAIGNGSSVNGELKEIPGVAQPRRNEEIYQRSVLFLPFTVNILIYIILASATNTAVGRSREH